jgi:hypothetical protein
VAAGQVHDAEAAHAKSEPIFDEGAPVVRTPVGNRVAHPEDLGLGHRPWAGLTCYAAHYAAFFFPQATIMYPEENGIRWSSMVHARSAG